MKISAEGSNIMLRDISTLNMLIAFRNLEGEEDNAKQ